MRRGVTKIYFLPEIAAATNVPTRQEITSGTELSGAISDIAGWSLGNSPIDTPTWARRSPRRSPVRTRPTRRP